MKNYQQSDFQISDIKAEEVLKVLFEKAKAKELNEEEYRMLGIKKDPKNQHD